MFDVVIVGAGPAGSSAALFTAKAGKKTLLLDNDKGMTKRAWVENHLGVMEIAGPELVEIGKKQATKFGAEVVQADVTSIDKIENGFKVVTENGEHEAKHVIIATGISTDVAAAAGVATKEGTEPRIKTVLDVDASGKTNVEGIWAAGTCAGVSVHTIITAGERYVDHDLLK